jgi:hypothetical protein
VLTLQGGANGIKEETANTLKVYPNPATNTLWFSNFVYGLNNIVKIYSTDGRYICEREIVNENINIENLESGLYIILTSQGISRFCKINKN